MIERYLALTEQERRDLLGQTASRMSIDPVIVEKDIWVCAILSEIFAHKETENSFIFKGGTCLSKVYGLINRFSEDIDLILDWRALGLGPPDHDPWDSGRSRNRQDAFNKAVTARTHEYLRDALVPMLNKILPDGVEVSASSDNQQGVVVEYPAVYASSYIRDGVLLEIGPLAAWTPWQPATIRPEVGRFYPQVVGDDPIPVRATTAERTFWEKITIAHWIASSGKTIPARYARHYYDIIMLTRAGVADRAIADLVLLESVVEFKKRFYWSAAAQYDLASPGTLRIVPGNDQLSQLERDYRNMQTMFYQTPPRWSEVVDELAKLQTTINGDQRT